MTNEATAELKEDWEEVSKFHWRTYNDPNMKRQFKQFSVLGYSALSDRKFERFTKITSEMMKVYSTAKLCEYQNATNCNLTLDGGKRTLTLKPKPQWSHL